jgi:glycosyltransferase involved in cell wall biosynthesis
MATTRGHRTVIPNGIDLERWAVTAPPTNERPRLVLVAGSAGTWQGVDKAVRLAAALPDVDVQIVGRDGPEGVPRSGGEGRGRPANVAYLGTLEGDAYRAALAGADAGLGPLALHRKGMDAACPLKVREYLAAGLPVVAAYSDDDLPDDADFVLRIPNTEDNVERHAGEVREFVAAWRGRRVSRDAVAHLDQACKEQERLAFFGGVLGAGG